MGRPPRQASVRAGILRIGGDSLAICGKGLVVIEVVKLVGRPRAERFRFAAGARLGRQAQQDDCARDGKPGGGVIHT